MLFRHLPSLSSTQPLCQSRPGRLSRLFSITSNDSGKIPELPFKKTDKVIPDYFYELQDKMVNRFQFEKLIPDKLQETFSEYVGQLEQDYAELYPLIKEFGDKTEEELQAVRDEKGEPLYARFSTREGTISSNYIGRKDPSNPGLWLMRLDYNNHDPAEPGVSSAMYIGRFRWKNILTEPRSQGRIYYQGNKHGGIATNVFSFITHDNGLFVDSSITIRGGGSSKELLEGKFTDLGFMRCSFDGQLHVNKLALTIDCKTKELRTNVYLGNKQARYVSFILRSRENNHMGSIYMDTMHFDQDNLTQTEVLQELPRGYMSEGYTGAWMQNNKGKYVYVANDDSVQLYEGGLSYEYRYQGEGKLESTHPQARQIGTFEDGAIIKGITETSEYKYEGEYKVGVQHGFGKSTFVNGDSYEGEWVEGAMHGKGVYNYKDGNIFNGYFDNNAMTGPGEMQLAGGAFFKGEFEQNSWTKGSISTPISEFTPYPFIVCGVAAGLNPFLQTLYHICRVYWISLMNKIRPSKKVFFSKYEGTFNSENVPHGYGVYTDLTGNRYEGEYRDGEQTGLAKSETYFGDKYTGEFREGAYHGRGRLEMPRSNQVYEGEFAEGYYNGYGKLTTFKRAQIIVAAGEWKNGELEKRDEANSSTTDNTTSSSTNSGSVSDHIQKFSSWQAGQTQFKYQSSSVLAIDLPKRRSPQNWSWFARGASFVYPNGQDPRKVVIRTNNLLSTRKAVSLRGSATLLLKLWRK